jgi:hypothetical protein
LLLALPIHFMRPSIYPKSGLLSLYLGPYVSSVGMTSQRGALAYHSIAVFMTKICSAATQRRSVLKQGNFLELRHGTFVCGDQSSGPEGTGAPARKQEEEAARLKGKGGKRGPPECCDTYNPTAAKRASPLPGDHNQIYQVAISRSPLSPRPDDPEPLAG